MAWRDILAPIHAPRRLRFQIYVDILRSIHFSMRDGGQLSLYKLERMSALTYNRLHSLLGEMQAAGLLNADLSITDRGYRFLSDVSTRVVPTLVKYGFWHD
jgi:predicted transcriptional regulator